MSALKRAHQFLKIFDAQFVVFDVILIALVLQMMNHHFERFVVFPRTLLDAHDDVAVHLNEATITVPGKAFVLGRIHQSQDTPIIETKV